ncbi:MAG: hypothetical protein AB7E51_18985 [Pseudodesulfovibrio sp.]|uniref:hypothetical protein n=1 Tax=Pseudodesulfovibrio sp. TaxID=2035812 RepID=UPI003D0DD653
MSEILARYRSLAPWIGIVGVLVSNLALMSYMTGVMSQRLSDVERRVAQVEVSDREQSRWLERIASMESDVRFIREELRSRRGPSNQQIP